MSHANQSEPFIIHNILTPSSDSSFIYNLILSYSQKLNEQNPHFLPLFKQKQQKLSRHNDQLKLLNEMKEDQMLRQQVLEQIQLKEYEKQYQSLFGQSNSSFTDQRPLSYRLKQNSKQHRSFHFTNRQQKSSQKSAQIKVHQKSSFGREQSTRKFRSSIIKSGSFSSIKKKKAPFQNNANIIENDNRNSEDTVFAYSKNSKPKGYAIKKKGIASFDSGYKQAKSKEIFKNQIFEQSQTNQQKQENKQEQQPIDSNEFHQECSSEQSQNFPQQATTKRTDLKRGSSKLPSVSVKNNSLKKDKSGDSGKNELKYYMKENKQNPYHISNFLRQINSCHYVSQYNQLKGQTKRYQPKKE